MQIAFVPDSGRSQSKSTASALPCAATGNVIDPTEYRTRGAAAWPSAFHSLPMNVAALVQSAWAVLGQTSSPPRFALTLPQRAKHVIGTQGPWHRPLHLILFALTAVAARAAFPRRKLAAPVLLLALAFSLELSEHLVFHNLFEWRDLRDDAIGILAGLTLFSALSVSSVRD